MALVVGIFGLLVAGLFIVVGVLICLTIILCIIGLPIIIVGYFLAVGAGTIAWAGLKAILWKPKFESREAAPEAAPVRSENKMKRRAFYVLALVVLACISLFVAYSFVNNPVSPQSTPESTPEATPVESPQSTPQSTPKSTPEPTPEQSSPYPMTLLENFEIHSTGVDGRYFIWVNITRANQISVSWETANHDVSNSFVVRAVWVDTNYSVPEDGFIMFRSADSPEYVVTSAKIDCLTYNSNVVSPDVQEVTVPRVLCIFIYEFNDNFVANTFEFLKLEVS